MHRELGLTLQQYLDELKASVPPKHTTHISVIDTEGNAAAITTTVNFYFGSCQVASSPGRGTTVAGRIGTGRLAAGNSSDAPSTRNAGDVPVAGRMG